MEAKDASMGSYISNIQYINGYNAASAQGRKIPPIDVLTRALERRNARPMRSKRMSVGAALEQLLRLIHRRAIKLAMLPEDERDSHYDRIRLSCCAAAEHIGQDPDRAAITANDMVEFVRALVGIIEVGSDPSADQRPPVLHSGSHEMGTTRI